MYIHPISIKTNVHSKRMYIRHIIDHLMICIGPNRHSKRMYIQNECLLRFECDCHTMAMFAIYSVWLPHYGNMCHILSMIASMCACLLCFKYDCHTAHRCFLTCYPRLGSTAPARTGSDRLAHAQISQISRKLHYLLIQAT